MRDVAPDVLLIGNIGLAQLDGLVVPDLVKALDRVGANALAVHTNPLQEAMQHEGDTDFSGSISRLREIGQMIGYPVMLKEVGHGIGAAAAAELVDCPLAAVDVASACGTSWARVEQFVRYGDIRYPALAEWGIPTAAGGAGRATHSADMPIVAVGRHPHRHGRRHGVGDGRRRAGGGPAAAGAGDRIRLPPLWIGCSGSSMSCWCAYTVAAQGIWPRCAAAASPPFSDQRAFRSARRWQLRFPVAPPLPGADQPGRASAARSPS